MLTLPRLFPGETNPGWSFEESAGIGADRMPGGMSPPRDSRVRVGAALLVVACLAACRPAPGSAPSPRPSASALPLSSSAPAAGSLAVSAPLPGAAVFLDGRRLGLAPQQAEGLAPGSHRVRVEKPGFRPFEMQVQVLPGREARVEARLEAESPRLRVQSDVPGAQVFLDRKAVGTTPVELEVTPGPHRLNVSAEGYEMFAEDIDVASGRREVAVRFKEVRLDASVDVVHKHGVGSCQGRLTATPAGIRYEASRAEDSFAAPLDAFQRFEVDYLAKTLRVSLRGGRTYNFTTREPNADSLLAFQKNVEDARRRLAAAR